MNVLTEVENPAGSNLDALWRQYDLILQETARQLTKVWLLRFQRTRA